MIRHETLFEALIFVVFGLNSSIFPKIAIVESLDVMFWIWRKDGQDTRELFNERAFAEGPLYLMTDTTHDVPFYHH